MFNDMPSSIGRTLGLVVFFIVWAIVIFLFPVFWVYTLTIPPILIVNFAKRRELRDRFISCFVVIWLVLFFYNNTRHMLLEPFFRKSLHNPTFNLAMNKFLFPPAGPIMFYDVGDAFGYHKVFGIKGGQIFELDPHQIYLSRTLFYDNVHRGVLGDIADPGNIPLFCRVMHRRMPEFDDFAVVFRVYPSLMESRYQYRDGLRYRCGDILAKEKAGL